MRASEYPFFSPIQTFFNSSETAYAADVKNNDLLQGLTGTHLNYRPISGPVGPQINDGVNGAASDGAAIAWASDGNITSSTYEIGSGDGAGYDISRITSISAWNSTGFMNQKYKISVRYSGAMDFTPVPECSVDYQPFTNIGSTPGATKVVITRPDGMVFRKIEATRFTVLDTNSSNAGGLTWREIDVERAKAVPQETRILSVDPSAVAQGKATIVWQSLPAVTYRIESTSDLETWTLLDAAYPSG